jgi:hypothetical protein
MITVKVHGGPELRRKFDQLADATKDRFLDTAVEAGAQLIRNRAAELAPYRSGTLRRSLRAERSE